jgi:hypothetical protein
MIAEPFRCVHFCTFAAERKGVVSVAQDSGMRKALGTKISVKKPIPRPASGFGVA